MWSWFQLASSNILLSGNQAVERCEDLPKADPCVSKCNCTSLMNMGFPHKVVTFWHSAGFNKAKIKAVRSVLGVKNVGTPP